MVISRMGGVYADLDVECRQPLDAIILPSDTLLVGWEQEAPASAAARATPAVAGPAALPPDPAKQQVPPVTPRQPPLARTRQILNWFFAAAPRHPVLREMCDHIARNAMSSFSSNEVRDTMERTGLGVWTDVVLKYAMQHPEDQVRAPQGHVRGGWRGGGCVARANSRRPGVEKRGLGRATSSYRKW